MVSKLKQYLHRFTSRQLIEKSASNINNTLEVVRIGEKVHLNSANTNYSYGGLHRVFQKAFKEVKHEQGDVTNVLILGFGAGSVASILQEELKIDCHITGVENDPEVIRLGKEYFNTQRFRNLELIEKDAVAFMNEETRKFELIVVDVYVDFEVPENCQTVEFVHKLHECLSPGGMVLFNKLIYNHRAGKEAEELENKFRTLPGETKVIKIREQVMNKMIVYQA